MADNTDNAMVNQPDTASIKNDNTVSGAKLKTEYCIECGTKRQPRNAKFCSHCGRAFGKHVRTRNAPSPFTFSGRRNRKMAGLLAILAGWIGLHKFYLGYTTEGIILLLVSIIGGLCSHWVMTGIVAIFTICEGVIYLMNTDDAFDTKYVDGKRTWF